MSDQLPDMDLGRRAANLLTADQLAEVLSDEHPAVVIIIQTNKHLNGEPPYQWFPRGDPAVVRTLLELALDRCKFDRNAAFAKHVADNGLRDSAI